MARLRPIVERVAFGWRLVAALAAPASGARATSELVANVRAREANFRARLERDLWDAGRRPYRALLELGGWTPDRVRAAVARTGLEATLAAMAGDGVRLDPDEAKGRRPIVRRGHEVAFAPRDLEAVRGPAVPLSTSGSSGRSSTNPIDLEGFRLLASCLPALLDALEANDVGAPRARPIVLYYPASSAAGVAHSLAFALAGRPAAAWFCHLPEGGGPLSEWRLWSRALRLAARARGVALPRARHTGVERPAALVDWLARRAPGGATIATFPGSAVRVRRYARAAGARLPPLTWILGGEPISARKRARLEADGDRVYPWYGAVDLGRVAIGCLDPAGADDMHLLSDRLAAHVAPAAENAACESGPPRGPLLLTSLLPSVHRALLNVDTGDRVELVRRRCGCALGELGLEQHLLGVHSAEKLTLDGATFDADRVHELASELLPAAVGGSPDDFQLVEEEGDDGLTRLVVRVEPSLGADASAVEAVVHRALVEAAGADAMAERLRRGRAVVVRSEAPRLSRGGKALVVARREPESRTLAG